MDRKRVDSILHPEMLVTISRLRALENGYQHKVSVNSPDQDI
jgi:hypothetical protein